MMNQLLHMQQDSSLHAIKVYSVAEELVELRLGGIAEAARTTRITITNRPPTPTLILNLKSVLQADIITKFIEFLIKFIDFLFKLKKMS